MNTNDKLRKIANYLDGKEPMDFNNSNWLPTLCAMMPTPEEVAEELDIRVRAKARQQAARIIVLILKSDTLSYTSDNLDISKATRQLLRTLGF